MANVEPRAGEEAEHGSTAELQRLADAAPLAEPEVPEFEAPVTEEALPAEVEEETGGEEVDIIPEPGGLFDDEEFEELDPLPPEEEWIYGGTARADEPLTAGTPRGPGPDMIRAPMETDEQFLRRTATMLDASEDPDARRFAARIRAERGG